MNVLCTFSLGCVQLPEFNIIYLYKFQILSNCITSH